MTLVSQQESQIKCRSTSQALLKLFALILKRPLRHLREITVSDLDFERSRLVDKLVVRLVSVKLVWWWWFVLRWWQWRWREADASQRCLVGKFCSSCWWIGCGQMKEKDIWSIIAEFSSLRKMVFFTDRGNNRIAGMGRYSPWVYIWIHWVRSAFEIPKRLCQVGSWVCG